jgi:hypothetical protein
MLTRSELPENPVVLTVVGQDGRRHTITTERVRGGRIRMACTCDASRAQGWCRHQVDLLCTRYDALANRNEDVEFHFEDIVMGTPLADTADEVDMALAEYEEALRALEGTGGVPPDGALLRTVAERASDLAAAATQLDGALARFRKRLASGASEPVQRDGRFDFGRHTLR